VCPPSFAFEWWARREMPLPTLGISDLTWPVTASPSSRSKLEKLAGHQRHDEQMSALWPYVAIAPLAPLAISGNISGNFEA